MTLSYGVQRRFVLFSADAPMHIILNEQDPDWQYFTAKYGFEPQTQTRQQTLNKRSFYVFRDARTSGALKICNQRYPHAAVYWSLGGKKGR